jgi:arylsulfatase A-like enzyme
MGARGDAIVQLDWCVGEVLAALDRYGLADNTLVLFTSDNGPVIDDGYRDEAVKRLGDHQAAGPWRGGKYRVYEGGTRVPWIVRWPARVAAGQESAALVSQVDLPATFAALADAPLPAGAAPDSVNVLPALLGEQPQGREELVEHARVLALRAGPWKLIEGPEGKGGKKGRPQLYNLDDDPGEQRNLADKELERLKEMTERLKAIRRE